MLKVEEIRELINLIDESSIDEFKYETEGGTVSMKKAAPAQSHEVRQVSAFDQTADNQPAPAQTEPVQPSPAVESVTEQSNEPASNSSSQTPEYDKEIVSPMVGTFYSTPSPENDVYVNVGSIVEKDSVVCIIEAMKLFNEIEAEVSGEIVEILADNGELVEYGQPLFRVKTQ